MDLVFFGIQGSGKGTQAKKLAAAFGYDIFEAGGELRKIVASGSELGITVKNYIDQGHLVPHEIIMKVVKEAIAARPKDQKILFDGIPRDIDQMNDFNAIMQEAGRGFRCIEFTLNPEAAMQRIFGRAKAEGRADDADEAIIRRRMDTFATKTVPVIKQYEAAGQLHRISAEKGVEDIYNELVKAIQSA